MFYIGIGTLLFGNPLKPIHFFLSSYFVSTGNNDIAIYNHDNFFFMLTPSILLILIFYLSDDPLKNLWIFILLFPLFIEFKHGFTRKDTSHIHDLIMFYSEILMFYFIVQKSINVIKILIGILIPFLTHINIKDTFNSENFGIFPLRNNVFLLNNTSKNHDHFSIRQQMHNIQSDSILFKKMKGKTADVFPWDQTILLSNQTKWIPRPSILMNSNQFCDSINKIFVIKDTPFFYLMHKIPNFDGIQYSSLDDKYLFNNEPEFTNTLLEYYTTDTSTYNYLLLKKRFTKRKLTKKTLSEFNVFPYKFYKIPECAEDEILKLSLSLKINLKEKLLSALYKPNPIWIKLFTKENIILIFRCSLYSLQKGIWLHPLLYRENIVLHPTYFSFQTIGFSSGEAKFTTYRFSDSLKEYFFSEKKYSSITLIKSITGQLNKSIYYPISDSFLEDTLLISTDYPEYSFKIKFDTLPKFNAFCSINLPLFLNELKDLKEIKIVLYKKGISHLPFPIKELSMANYYKKDMSVQHIQLLLNPWEIDYNAEYSLHLINLPNAKISLLPLKINFYDFVN
ncbi:MAG: hypothetical protein N3F09_07480 [Bacteroidia bacterium]|nr:hypothetical protein [Bacteroidia bacterium]